MNDAVAIRTFRPSDLQVINVFIEQHKWPYHREGSQKNFSLDQLTKETKTILAFEREVLVGYIRITDFVDGETPLFDVRIAEQCRGKGVGTKLVKEATNTVFKELPHTIRFEATTRIDNEAMKNVLKYLGWTQEAHYRKGWQTSDTEYMDALGYAILREEWE